MTTQPEALRLAGALLEPVVLDKHAMQAADELRRLHAECEALRMERDALRAATGGRMGYFDDEVGKLHAECEALRASQADLRNDADKFGNALNEAGWAFVDAYRHHMGESEPPLLFNNCKSILRESILAFLDAAARAAKEQSK